MVGAIAGLGLLAAIYLSEYAGDKVRSIIKPALEVLAEQCPHTVLAEVWMDVRGRVAEGTTLDEAFAKARAEHPDKRTIRISLK